MWNIISTMKCWNRYKSIFRQMKERFGFKQPIAGDFNLATLDEVLQMMGRDLALHGVALPLRHTLETELILIRRIP